MKKVAGILAVVAFTVGMFVTQVDKMDFDFDIETMLACVDCDDDDPRGGTA
ncbi:hypothetical protein [Maribacter sp. 2308TA10-17]|uniref:hypothetical protein n=1 Tax=Maribacter sp. 2308TA10-17 TaxID=3386276 RepID=UPI0039BD5D27